MFFFIAASSFAPSYFACFLLVSLLTSTFALNTYGQKFHWSSQLWHRVFVRLYVCLNLGMCFASRLCVNFCYAAQQFVRLRKSKQSQFMIIVIFSMCLLCLRFIHSNDSFRSVQMWVSNLKSEIWWGRSNEIAHQVGTLMPGWMCKMHAYY